MRNVHGLAGRPPRHAADRRHVDPLLLGVGGVLGQHLELSVGVQRDGDLGHRLRAAGALRPLLGDEHPDARLGRGIDEQVHLGPSRSPPAAIRGSRATCRPS
jgi:hypothetical protein